MNALYSRPRFSYNIRNEELETVFYISGVMDIQGGEELREEIKQIGTEKKEITFNLSDTRIISSGGLTLLVEIAKMLKDDGTLFHVDQPTDMVLRTLKVVHVDKIIDIRTA